MLVGWAVSGHDAGRTDGDRLETKLSKKRVRTNTWRLIINTNDGRRGTASGTELKRNTDETKEVVEPSTVGPQT